MLIFNNEVKNMKISVFIFFLVMVAGILFIFGQAINEGNSMYGTSINKSEWETQYDFSDNIKEDIDPLKTSFETLQDENKGILTKIGAGLVAIPYAIFLIPKILFETIFMAGTMVTGFASALNLPLKLVVIITLGILVWGVFKLAEMFQRSNI
jgi:hypothetical protein